MIFSETTILKDDGAIKKAQVIDAFVNPENLDEKIITVEFYYGITTKQDLQGTTVYEGYSNRESFNVGIPVDNTEIEAKIQNLWDTVYSKLDTGVTGLEELKSFSL